MRIIFLGTSESWHYRDLRRAAAGRYEVMALPLSRLASEVDAGAVRVASRDQLFGAGDRVLVRAMPPGSLEQVVFRMDALAQLEAAGVTVVNSTHTTEVAVDKYLATARLRAAQLPVPATAVCQTADDAMEAYTRLGGDVVIKPLFGSEGRGIARISDEAIALRTFKLLAPLGAVIYLQEFIAHEGHDLRVLVIGERLFAMRRSNALDWRTNASRGAACEAVELSDELARLARRSAAAVGARLAGVDLLPGRDGAVRVLEVNAAPGWRALSKTTDADIAAEVIALLASTGVGRG